ncbi:AAA family ATPase [Ramlibacter sp.]|uniref:AAA family ATPase n=1 Tax=Ramlibacter sp. TaxID=1917967 RepID=UPI003D0C2FD6
MKISTIRVESLRKFREPYTLAALDEGINLVVAPNGGGKSTLAEAVRAAFLERYKSAKPAESLAPHSQPGASPSVQVEFSHEGKSWRVTKTFGPKKSCTLESDGASESGEEAENRLAQMFSFGFAGRGASQPDVQGIPGLLWVKQGQSGDIDDRVEHAHEHLSRALGDAVGELAATAGDRVIERVEAELAALQTKTGKPTGEYGRVLAQLEAAVGERDAVLAKVQQYEAMVDRFGARRQALADVERRRPWEALKHQLASAQAKLDEASGLVGQREQAAMRLQMAKADVERCLRELGVLADEEQAVEVRQAALDRALARDAETLAAVRHASESLLAAQEADTAARARSVHARKAASRSQHVSAAASLLDRLEKIQRVQASVDVVHADIETRERERGQLVRFAGAGKRLAKQRDDLMQARARLDAVATRIEYQLLGDGVAIEGAPVSGDGSRTVVEPVTLSIAGVGTLRIVPGGEDLSVLRADAQRKEAALAGTLGDYGANTVEEAIESEHRLVAIEVELKQLRSNLKALAPDGVDALRAERMRVESERAGHLQALEGMAELAADAPLGVVEAEAAEAATKASLDAAQARADKARQEAAQAIAQRESAQRECDQARGKLEAPGREARKLAAQNGWVTARAQESVEKQALDEIEARLRAANLEQLKQDVERFGRSAAAQEEEYRNLRIEVHGLEGELKAMGALGLGDDAAEKQDAVARLQRDSELHSRKAHALAHLLGLLQEKRAALARRIRAPLQVRLNHYLQIQYPGVQIELDEMLRPSRITRQGPHGFETAKFGELSGGEREQLGIIARLAYADLLREKGKPTLLMLDDALVNTDRERLAQMKRVLYDAAQRHQVIVFTCHEENWGDMGVVARRLA